MPSLSSCFAVTPPGIEGLAAEELRRLGITPGETETGGVAFDATPRQLYAANLELRTANRVIVRLAEFPARAFYELERKAKRVPWGDVLAGGTPVRFRVTSRKSKLYHLHGIAERLTRAARGEAGGTLALGEEEEPETPGQLFVVRVVRDIVTISADSSGESLHRRGYRQATSKAPLRETLAAAMLLGAGYDGSVPLVDPFAGSGTIPIEAALLARRTAPGLKRGFGFERWPQFDSAVWAELREEARVRMLPRAAAPILGSDRDAGAIRAARDNAERAGAGGDIEWRECAISGVVPPPGPGLLVTNPPYGVRVGNPADLRNLYAQIGKVARAKFPGWTLAMLSADPVLEGQVGLPFTERWRSSNGGLPVRLVTAPC
jgi:putative N6-adenine-specific DNA methylase